MGSIRQALTRYGISGRTLPRNLAHSGDSRAGNTYSTRVAVPYTQVLREDAPLLWAGRRSKGRYFHPVELNYGISGQTAAQFAARSASDAADATTKLGGPGVVIITDPTNSYATVDPSADMETTFKAWTGLGWIVITWYPTPRGSGFVLDSTGLANQLVYASWLKTNARRLGVLISDASALLADKTVTNGTFVPAANAMVDSLHFGFPGAFYQGAADQALLDSLFLPVVATPSNPSDLFSATNPYGNLLSNPFMAGSQAAGSGAAGNIPTSFASAAPAGVTATFSKSDANTTRLVVSGTPSANGTILLRQSFSTNIALGDRIKMFADVKVVAGTAGVAGLGLQCQLTDSGGQHSTFNGSAALTGSYLPADSWEGTLETPANIFQGSSVTNGQWYFAVNVINGVAVTLDMTIANAVARKCRSNEF